MIKRREDNVSAMWQPSYTQKQVSLRHPDALLQRLWNTVQRGICEACNKPAWRVCEYADLSVEHGISVGTIKRKLSTEQCPFMPFTPLRSVVLTFGRNWGVMIFLDSESGRVFHRKFVKNETNALYLESLEEIKRRRTEILGIVCDGHPRLINAIDFCPVQMCWFHILQIIRRKLTENPRLNAGRELL